MNINTLRVFVLSIVAVVLSACSTMTPPRYSVDAENNMALRQKEGASVSVAHLVDNVNFSANCRLMGPIQASDGRDVSTFIKDSFNDEFKFAAIYGDDGAAHKLELAIEKLAYSSMSGLTSGWWDIGILLQNMRSGTSIQVSTHHTFKSGFDAVTACNQTADALTAAVQDLIRQAVTHPSFDELIGYASTPVEPPADASRESSPSSAE